jgi:hypothetical protein
VAATAASMTQPPTAPRLPIVVLPFSNLSNDPEQRSGNQVRVNAQLIDAEKDAHLWAERFDHDLGDLFVLQNEITGRIANTLGVELIAAEAARRAEHPARLTTYFANMLPGSSRNSSAVYSEAVGQFERAL